MAIGSLRLPERLLPVLLLINGALSVVGHLTQVHATRTPINHASGHRPSHPPLPRDLTAPSFVGEKEEKKKRPSPGHANH